MNELEEVATAGEPADAGPMQESTSAPERLTWEEIRARYPNEHVILVDTEGPGLVIKKAVVYAHHPDLKTVFAMARHLRSCAWRWTGERSNFVWMVGRVDRRL